MKSSPLIIALGGMIAMAATIGIGRFVYTPILPYMADALALTKGEAGLIPAANFLGYLTVVMRGDRRRWTLWALALSAATTAAMALTVSVPAFLLLRFVGGATSAFVMVFGSAIVFDRLAAAGRSELTHYHFAGVGIGMSISAVLVSGLGAIGIGWSGQWLASGAVAAIALAAVMVMIPRRAGSIPPPAPKSTAGFDRRIIPLAIAYGLFGFGYVITATFISVLVRQTPSIAAIEPVI